MRSPQRLAAASLALLIISACLASAQEVRGPRGVQRRRAAGWSSRCCALAAREHPLRRRMRSPARQPSKPGSS